MNRRERDRPREPQRDRAGGMERDPAISGDKPRRESSMEREQGTIRPGEPQKKRGDRDIIR
jgi:hypothetical protein